MFSNDEMAKMMANLAELQHNYDDDDNQTGDSNENIKNNMSELNKIMPLMSNIMENLLSKDFLYPTLSELRTKVSGLMIFFCLFEFSNYHQLVSNIFGRESIIIIER